MQLQRHRAVLAASLALGAMTGQALAHGGTYQPPPVDTGEPLPPPPPEEPRNPGSSPAPNTPPFPPPPGSGGPSPGGGGGGGPEGGPPTGGGGGGGGASTGGARGKSKSGNAVHNDHWTRWWSTNRASIVAVSGRVRERAVSTPSTDAAAEKPRAELWRAAAQEALTLALSDPDDDVASGAAVALGKAGDPGDAAPLIALMTNSARGQQAREGAALALGLLAPDPGVGAVRAALERIAADTGTPDRLRGFAVYALGLRGDPAAVPFLVSAAQSNALTWDVPAAGASALGIVRCADTREDLERILAGPKADRARDAERRVYAAHGLVRLGDRAAVPALREAASDDDVNVRRAAVLALGALAAADDAASTAAICHVLRHDKDRACRNMAAISLGRVAPDCASRELRSAYEDGDPLEQPFAALGIGLSAKRQKDAAEGLKLLRRDLAGRASSDTHGAICIALGLAGDDDAIPLLRKIAADRGDPDLRAHAAAALGLLGDRDGSPPILREMLRDAATPAMQREAATALGMLGDAEAVTILLGLVTDGSSVYVQGSAAVALGRIGGAESAASLGALLKDATRPGISRAMAAVGLGLLLDRTEGRRLGCIGADLDWFALTPTVREILDIL